MPTSVSVVIPAYNAADQLTLCLDALRAAKLRTAEIILVDDGSTDDTVRIAASYGCRVLHTGGRRGPACARNIGAKAAPGEIVLFVDSDVSVQPDTIDKFRSAFESDPQLDGLIGSYDSEPVSPNFLSQYRNLMHCFVHHDGKPRASTFWSGCGAIRRGVFLQHHGFSEAYDRPAIEDIELGYRLVRDGHKIILNPSIEVKHMKRWSLRKMLRTDILDRALPWTELILRDRFMPNDLNLRIGQRVSVALGGIFAALVGAATFSSGARFLAPFLSIVLVLLARWWAEPMSVDDDRLRRTLSLAVGTLAALCAYQYGLVGLTLLCGLNCVILPILAGRLTRGGSAGLRWGLRLYIAGALLYSALLLPPNALVLSCAVVFALLVFLNRKFYRFLFRKRGGAFVLAAVPFHILYHVLNGLAFSAGSARHLWRVLVQEARDARVGVERY